MMKEWAKLIKDRRGFGMEQRADVRRRAGVRRGTGG